MAGGIINTSSYSLDLEPLVKQARVWFGDKEKLLDPIYPKLFETKTTNIAINHASQFGGLPDLARVKAEGAPVTYSSMSQGPDIETRVANYALGYQLTFEMMKFGQTGIAMKKGAEELRASLSEKKEELMADVLDNAFGTSLLTDPSGLAICDTSHVLQNGQTMANELATSADLSESSLEQCVIEQSEEMKDYSGKRRVIPMERLVVPKEESFNAERILRSQLRVGTADNDLNAIRSLGFFRNETLVHDRLTDADMFLIKCTVPDMGMVIYQVDQPTFRQDNTFDTFDMKFVAHEMYGYNVIDVRCLFGSPGAA